MTLEKIQYNIDIIKKNQDAESITTIHLQKRSLVQGDSWAELQFSWVPFEDDGLCKYIALLLATKPSWNENIVLQKE